jgi:cysteinyl-tRNA synthetase
MLEFSFEALDESATAFRRIENFLTRAREATGALAEPVIAPEFAAVMNDDLSVPQGLALISEWLRAGNSALTAGKKDDIATFSAYIRGALGILGCDPYDAAYGSTNSADLTGAVDGLIALLLEQREAARERKDFAAADSIRDRITAMGISIEDTPQGPRWSIS